MNSRSCKVCCNRSLVTSDARTIRCHGCQRTNSSRDNKLADFNSFGRSSCSYEPVDFNSPAIRKCLPFYRKPDFNSPAIRKCLPFYRKPSKNTTFHCSMAIRTLEPPRGKRALLCGVSYKNNKNKLKGTAQDALKMKNLLSQKFGFPDNAFLILGEDEKHQQPTRSNILEAFKWLVTDLQHGDSLVFYFSGHGLRQQNLDEDEIDGFDEAICPVDFETAGMIVDNEINQMIVAPLKEGVTLHAIVDSCHSGTLLDLPYTYNRNKAVWDLPSRVCPSRVCKGTSGGHAICISACEDYQLATDTSLFSPDRTMAGAMTHTFIKAVNGKQDITYRDLLNSMRHDIAEANKSISRGVRRLFHCQMLQDPNLSSSKPFSIDKVFTL